MNDTDGEHPLGVALDAIAAAGYERGRERERADTIAWLRSVEEGERHGGTPWDYDNLIAGIESGQHVRPVSEEK